MSKKVYFFILIICLVFSQIPYKSLATYNAYPESHGIHISEIKIPSNVLKTYYNPMDLLTFKNVQIKTQEECERTLSSMGSVRRIFEWVLDKARSLFAAKGFEGTEDISSLFLNLIFKSILTLLFAFIIWQLGKILLHRLFKLIEFFKTRYPEFEFRISSYSNITRKIFNVLMIVLTILFLLHVWGIKVFQFLANYSEQIYSLIRIPLILILSILLIHISRLIVSRLEKIIGTRMKSRPGLSKTEIDKQITTIGELIYKTIMITIWIVAIMMVLKELGFDIKPILAGAGIVGLAVGFGAQNLVRDVISGLFMIIENQVRVGDVAILNGTGGLVEAVNLRTTVLRGLDGAVHVFPNGTINTISNLTHNFSYYVFDIGVAYKEDVDRVIGILKKISDEIMANPTYSSEILEPLEILGLDKFGDSAIIIKARIKTRPIKQWMVGREMNLRIKKRFDEENIEIPFPHRTLYFGDASKPFDINIEDDKETKTRLKKWIKEVLVEDKREKDKNQD